MTIYSGKNYRKIWESHFGQIPYDNEGRRYEIHHIDGNSDNNDISNLQCVTIQEHYDIHLRQEDWNACLLIAKRMLLSPQIQNELNRKGAKLNSDKRVKEGTHHFLGGKIQKKVQDERVKSGNHHWLSGDLQRDHQNKRVKSGTHQFLGGEIQRRNNLKLAKEGRHPFQNIEAAKIRLKKQIESGRHASQIIKICEHCNKETDTANYSRWHGPKCKHAT